MDDEELPKHIGLKILLCALEDKPIESLLTEKQQKALMPFLRANLPNYVERPVLPPPERDQLPPEFMSFLIKKGATGSNYPKLIFVKKLYSSDVDEQQARLSMPHKKIAQRFLTEEEEDFIRGMDKEGKRNKLEVTVVHPLKNDQIMSLTKWSGKGENWKYVLNRDWNNFVRDRGLAVDDTIQVWSFRLDHDCLGFIIYK